MENRGAVKIGIVLAKDQRSGEAVVWRKARRALSRRAFANLTGLCLIN
jgi:hypothetical protein